MASYKPIWVDFCKYNPSKCQNIIGVGGNVVSETVIQKNNCNVKSSELNAPPFFSVTNGDSMLVRVDYDNSILVGENASGFTSAFAAPEILTFHIRDADGYFIGASAEDKVINVK